MTAHFMTRVGISPLVWRLWQPDPPKGGSGRPIQFALLSLLLASAASPSFAQSSHSSDDTIVVTGQRSNSLPVERSISDDDLLSYGAATVGDLLAEVTAENGEESRSVTILVDGKRVTGTGDIDSFPAEALDRIEIIGRESGATVGAPAGSRVYNVVLKPETRLLAMSGRARRATDGGASSGAAEVSATRIRRPQRLNVSLQRREAEAIFESERQIIQPEGSLPNLGQARTLRPATSAYDFSLSAADQLLPWLDGLASLKLRANHSTAANGLASEGLTIVRSTLGRSVNFAVQLNAQRGSWMVTLDSGAREDRRRTSTKSGLLPQQTSTFTRFRHLDLLAHGPLIKLPAGTLHLTLGAKVGQESVGSLGPSRTPIILSRSFQELRAGIDVPILSRMEPQSWLGSLSARAELSRGSIEGIDQSIRTLSLRWSPSEWVQFSAVLNNSRTAPGSDLLGEPLLESVGVRYFDPLRMETVDLVAVTGGRLDLPSQASKGLRLTADVRPLRSIELLITGEYVASNDVNVVSVLPPANDLVLQLFPGRFSRDDAGRLARVDLRPVVLPRKREEQLRTTISLALPLSKRRSGPRVQFNGTYRLLLGGRLDLSDGFGVVDLLDRQSFAIGGSMRPRHQFDFTLGYSEKGLGVRLSGERRSESFLGAAEASSILTFDALTTLNLRSFVEGHRLAPNSNLLRNTRFGLELNNLTNSRERVQDGQGQTPVAYQAGIRDPVGRSVELELRKTF